MNYKTIKIDSLIKKITNKDQLFGGNYTIDPYQNCEFGCLYCDSSFDNTINIKYNAEEIFEKELKNIKKGTIIVGSVNDPYQKIEEKKLLTRRLLELIKKNNFPCHILTKSNKIIRDIDIISKIKNIKITISIISLNKSIYNIFEKNVPNPLVRLQTIKKLSESGIDVGCGIIPVLPFIVDNELENIIKSAKNYNSRYLIFKYLELKGDLKNYFFKSLKLLKEDYVDIYNKMYNDAYYPQKKYIKKLELNINNLCKKYDIKNKIKI